MSINHAFHIEKLKTDFENIITLKKEIAKIKSIVSEKLSQLKIQYNELVKTNSKKIFLFCLDSFYFQYKTFAMELEHIDRFRSLMNNRMYCDYYKLYNIIIAFIKENRTDLDIDELELKSYPTYKDLEPFQEYKLEDITDIHSNILVLLHKLYLQLNSKVDCVDHYNENHKIGFSISNFLNTLEYENRLLKEQISLYINYVSFFHISEKRQLNRLFMRMQEFYREIDENININRTFSIADIGEQDRLQRFYIIGEDVEIENILEDFEFTPSIIAKTITDPSGGNPSALVVPLPEANNEEPVLEKENVAMEMREYTEESQ
jgi:hypothetical protein